MLQPAARAVRDCRRAAGVRRLQRGPRRARGAEHAHPRPALRRQVRQAPREAGRAGSRPLRRHVRQLADRVSPAYPQFHRPQCPDVNRQVIVRPLLPMANRPITDRQMPGIDRFPQFWKALCPSNNREVILKSFRIILKSVTGQCPTRHNSNGVVFGLQGLQ